MRIIISSINHFISCDVFLAAKQVRSDSPNKNNHDLIFIIIPHNSSLKQGISCHSLRTFNNASLIYSMQEQDNLVTSKGDFGFETHTVGTCT